MWTLDKKLFAFSKLLLRVWPEEEQQQQQQQYGPATEHQ